MSICANIYIDFEQWCQYINIFKRWWPLGDHLERVFLLLFHLRIRTVATEDSRGVSLWRQLGLHFLPSCWYGRSCQTRAPVIRRPPTADSESCQLVRTTSYVASPSPPEPWSWSSRRICSRFSYPCLSFSPMTSKTSSFVVISFFLTFVAGEKSIEPPSPPTQETSPGKRWIFDVNCEDPVNPGVMGRWSKHLKLSG